ncbi:hypothetical protein E2C01_009486 [Portunus trituberculatus]|uniref:Uncharacterized protein n=1 Tax=Portunus trituberculatus TaxID=210409 RepID=A0A5B7D5X0_PORTR|nr:hypothetical protein [Portunus trituberculatus]
MSSESLASRCRGAQHHRLASTGTRYRPYAKAYLFYSVSPRHPNFASLDEMETPPPAVPT